MRHQRTGALYRSKVKVDRTVDSYARIGDPRAKPNPRPKTAIRNRVYSAVSAFLVRYSDVTPVRVALALEMSVRTLQRRLHAEGSSLQEIRDRVCRERAAMRLLDPGISVSSIASDLGFCDVAAFSKAFKRWTGKSPSDYRPPRQRRYSGRGPP
jgi:AraC-like DNA-binding protein